MMKLDTPRSILEFDTEQHAIILTTSETEFTIEQNLASEGVITLYDFSGKEIKTLFEGDLRMNSKIIISTEGIPSGLYLVQLQTESKQLSHKLIIQ